jgi:hypothetical protein
MWHALDGLLNIQANKFAAYEMLFVLQLIFVFLEDSLHVALGAIF